MNSTKSFAVDGVCHDIAGGEVTIELVLEACGGYSSHDSHIGWKNYRQFTVMELISQDQENRELSPHEYRA